MKVLLTKDKLMELISNRNNPKSMEECYNACVNGEIEAYEREAIVLMMLLVLE